MAKGYSGGKAGGSYSGGGKGGSYKGAGMSNATYSGAGMPSASYGTSGIGSVNYSANLTITSPSGQTLSYSQSLSIPYTPGTSVSYGSNLKVGGAGYDSKSISDLVQPYSARSAGKAKQSSRYPLAGLDRNAKQGKPYSLANIAGYDGTSHTDGYSLSESMKKNLVSELLKEAEDRFSESKYKINAEKDEEEKKKKMQIEDTEFCMICGRPAIKDRLCPICLEKTNYMEVN